MSDFLLYVAISAFVYLVSLIGIDFAYSKHKKQKRAIIAVIVIAVGLYNGAMLKLKDNTVTVDVVEALWKDYASYCREAHISWSDLTFPEWLVVEASQ